MEDGVFVTNISSSLDEKALRAFFSQFGNVTDFNLQPDKFNECTKICYLKYSSNDGAAKAVKMGDKSTQFGDPLRVSLKKFIERSPNGIKPTPNTTSTAMPISRMQSFGRGRGGFQGAPASPAFVNENVQLKDLVLPFEKKCVVEVVELKSLNNILIKPLALTEKSQVNLYGLLDKINANSDKLVNVKNVQLNGFYLAKWTEDNRFYRAKIIEKMNDNMFKVCFVDEGTIGDIVTELKVIPEELVEIPCQFVQCSMSCEESQELVQFIIQESNECQVSIFVSSSTKMDDKYPINFFINEKDVLDMYMSKTSKDPRITKFPSKKDLKVHSLGKTCLDCQLVKSTKEKIMVVLPKDTKTIDTSKLKPLSTSPIPNDVLMYKENNETWHRCIVESYKFIQDQLTYSICLVDENKSLETSKDKMMWAMDSDDIDSPPRVISGVIKGPEHSDIFLKTQTVKLLEYDASKTLYTIEVVVKEPEETQKVVSKVPSTQKSLVGQVKTAVVSHVESAEEFYVQFVDDASTTALESIQAEINSPGYQVVRINDTRNLRYNEIVIAPFLGVQYRAMVREMDPAKNCVLLFFIDFGNSDWVPSNTLMKAHSSMATKTNPLSHKCRLRGSIKTGQAQEVEALLMDYCDQMEAEVHLKIMDQENDTLIVNMSVANKSSLLDILEFKELLKPQPTCSGIQGSSDLREMLIKKVADLERRISILERTPLCK